MSFTERTPPMGDARDMFPYFEPVGQDGPAALASGADYLAGFESRDGARHGLRVPVSATAVELAVLRRAAFSIGLEPDGRVLLRSDGLSDEAFDAASRASLLPACPISALVTACVDPGELRHEEDPVGELALLRKELAAALAIVDATLARLRDAQPGSGGIELGSQQA